MTRLAFRGFPHLAALIAPQLRALPLIVMLGLAAAALEGFGIGLIIPLLGIILGNGGGDLGGFTARLASFGAGMSDSTRLVFTGGAIFLLILLKNVFAFANSLLNGLIYGKSGHAIRCALSDRLLKVGYPFFQTEDPGRLLNIISNESWRTSDAVDAVLSIIINACAVITLFIFLLLISWQLTLLVTLALIVIQALHAWLSMALKSASREVTTKNSRLASQMLHLINASQLVRMFNQEGFEQGRFAGASEAVRRAAFSLHRRLSGLPSFTEVLYAGVFLIIIGGSWYFQMSFPLITAFLVLLYRLQPYVRNLQGAYSRLQSFQGSLEAVEWLLDPAGKPAPPAGRVSPGDGKAPIHFNSVSFSYSGEGEQTAVLNDLTFTLKPGVATALVGRSGSGKTTIVKLLTRLIEPGAGAILLGDTPLSTVNPADWRQMIAMASQDLELVDGSVLENIAYGQPGASRETIEDAARKAEAHEFITALAEGYETQVGYRGINLSAGQRQRIALARALVRDPQILILDEATNAVDGLSEAAILATLKQRAGRQTTIVISHHRPTIEFCDEVVVLRDGRLAGQARLENIPSRTMDGLYDYSAG
ncbi:ABC transporter ATP-binding protein/permease [Hyphomonas sp. WL0036]|uniref:ABC transporter ATP-binding protein n=1 Tax=Hyphomonas sediminis TaxID=2866160 RepID=UPI001C7F1842|nr:ABC transporter ATP-binding protein [Hyphomonas sediminis]MBY9068522.1 ABC transporter ATP-binding protein/permease [Hyphomonas sediminis]